MSVNAASEEIMGRLHMATAERLLAELDAEELDPRIITACIAFLNNNKVIMNPYVTSALTDIEKKLQSKSPRFKVVRQKAEQASREAAERLAAEG